MIPSYPLYINAEFIKTPEKQSIINPATGEVIAEVAVAGEREVELAINSARTAFEGGDWPKISLQKRKEFLLKISQRIIERAQELTNLETLNTGKPIKESTFMDIPSSAKTFEYFANHLEECLKGESKQLENSESYLIREPRGVVVLIIPWNYPLLIASWKLAQALAAGNTVILKPSSLTPLTVLELAKIIHEAGLPKGVVNIINGSGERLGEALCSDKRIDMISFTGSNEVGRQIINYSAKSIKKLIMELGGKSASIVLKDVDLEATASGCLSSIFLNQGQMCTAMSRIFVEDDIYDNFLDCFVKKAKAIKLGNGLDYETQMGPVISQAQRDKVVKFVEEAKKQGAKLLCGGKIPDNPDFKKGFFFEPTVFIDINPSMRIFQQEVFGPVVCINKFSTIDEAVKLANDSDFALAGCIWTKDNSKAREIAQKINAGTIWINTYGMFYNEMPYGGFKQSGFGKELGKDGFLEYTRLKHINVDLTGGGKSIVTAWYV